MRIFIKNKPVYQMKRTTVVIVILLATITATAQDFEFRLRGGVNFQRTQSPDSEFSFLPHIGAMAGVRISTFGVYGEVLYSVHDNQNWVSEAAYIVPAVLVRFYGFRNVYAEGGLSYNMLADEQADGAMVEFPDGEIGYFAGLGYMFKKLEIGLRSTNPLTSIQINALYRF